MNYIKNFLCALVCLCVLPVGAVELSGTASVNVTSDTAAAAKNMAMDQARRQIIKQSLSQYSSQEQLNVALKDASSADLTPLVATTSIAGEQQSDMTYSANITMTIDTNAARDWMNARGVQNWLSDGANPDMFVANITLGNKIADWAIINRIARAEKLNLIPQNIVGNQVTIILPVSSRGAFTIALREAGWRSADNDGVLRVWK